MCLQRHLIHGPVPLFQIEDYPAGYYLCRLSADFDYLDRERKGDSAGFYLSLLRAADYLLPASWCVYYAVDRLFGAVIDTIAAEEKNRAAAGAGAGGARSASASASAGRAGGAGAAGAAGGRSATAAAATAASAGFDPAKHVFNMGSPADSKSLVSELLLFCLAAAFLTVFRSSARLCTALIACG